MYSVSDLRTLNDVQLEQYLDTDEGRADARVPPEILIRLFKARKVTVDEILAHSNPGEPEILAYSPITGVRVY